MNERIEVLTRYYTAFPTFEAMVLGAGCDPGYRPSLRRSGKSRRDREMNELAEAYDAAQTERGNAKRAA